MVFQRLTPVGSAKRKPKNYAVGAKLPATAAQPVQRKIGERRGCPGDIALNAKRFKNPAKR
jgi:hypothetical protein